MELNPYAAPEAEVLQAPSANAEAEAIRRNHINTEATIKSVGTLYCFSAIVVILACGAGLINTSPAPDSIGKGFLVVLLLLALFQGRVGMGLRRLEPWTRIATIVLSLIGLLAWPIGTLINIYILLKVAGKKGGVVFSPEYRDVIAATPHIKRKTSIVSMILLAVLILVLIGIITNLARS